MILNSGWLWQFMVTECGKSWDWLKLNEIGYDRFDRSEIISSEATKATLTEFYWLKICLKINKCRILLAIKTFIRVINNETKIFHWLEIFRAWIVGELIYGRCSLLDVLVLHLYQTPIKNSHSELRSTIQSEERSRVSLWKPFWLNRFCTQL